MLFGKKKRQIVRLLVVEDEPLVAFDTEYMLVEAKFTIVATTDRVLVDVNLADGSGIDVARAAHARGVPVMFVTGSCPVEATTLAAGCLSKPYAQRDLLDAIAAIEAMLEGTAPKRLPSGFTLFETRA
jgi:DNA-binding response OmpR family regulator